jgi:hypothetical protein
VIIAESPWSLQGVCGRCGEPVIAMVEPVIVMVEPVIIRGSLWLGRSL